MLKGSVLLVVTLHDRYAAPPAAVLAPRAASGEVGHPARTGSARHSAPSAPTAPTSSPDVVYEDAFVEYKDVTGVSSTSSGGSADGNAFGEASVKSVLETILVRPMTLTRTLR